MAKLSERLPDNAPGEFYVDRTCIDRDTCTRIAPGLFAGADDHSYVARQPETENDRLRALMALVSCPTASIGTVSRADTGPGVAAFPEPVAEEVFFLGFTSEDSFGAWSYLVRRQEGNVIVDSPRGVERRLLGGEPVVSRSGTALDGPHSAVLIRGAGCGSSSFEVHAQLKFAPARRSGSRRLSAGGCRSQARNGGAAMSP